MIEKELNLKNKRLTWVIKKEPRISFPIATYNRVDILIERTLPSILNQSYKNLEVVIVGDCVKDKDWLRLISSISDSRVVYHNLKTRTIYPADGLSFWCVAGYRPRNIASRISKGDWHWWISDDDIILDNAVENVVKYINFNSDAESIYGNYRINDNGKAKVITEKNINTGLPFKITGMPSWVNRCYLSKLYKWDGKSYLNKINKPSDYNMQFKMYNDGIFFGYFDEELSAVGQAIPSKNLQGSQAYIQHPEYFR